MTIRDEAAGGLVASIDDDGLRRPVSMVVAHPGHELLAYGWLLELAPRVDIVTDGSGRNANPRIEASADLLRSGLGTPGSIFGRWADLELYDALSAGRFEPFIELRDALAERWCQDGVRTVLCDGFELEVLMHDVVQVVADAAVAAAGERGVEIDLLEIPNHLGPDEPRPGDPVSVAGLVLSEQGLRHKISVARSYPSRVIQQEVEAFLGHRGERDFSTEKLFRAVHWTPDKLRNQPQPAWEKHGERLRAQGIYDQVIRLSEHFVRLVQALAPVGIAGGGPVSR